MSEEHLMSKWCEYCKKHGHTDDECWCTRAVWPITMKVVAHPKMKPITMAVLGTRYDISEHE